MVVQHNITAMNANRMLGVTTGSQAKSTEKLSSGYKINRAADDAAGLSISEKMRRQVRGLTQASSNAQDGISSVQTAEGALGEVHDMLQRMDELATKAANGTLSKDDRQNIQDEIDSLLTEIDRVSETTKFNETYLLKGDPNDTTASLKKEVMNAHDAGLKGNLVDNGDGTATFTAASIKDGDTINIGGKNVLVSDSVNGSIDSTDGTKNGNVVTGGALLNAVTADATLTYKTADDDDVAEDGWYDASDALVTEDALSTTYGLTVEKAERGDTIAITAKTDTEYDGTPAISDLKVSDLVAGSDGDSTTKGVYTYDADSGKFTKDGGVELDAALYGGTSFRHGDKIQIKEGDTSEVTKVEALTVELKSAATDAQKQALNEVTKDGELTFTYDGTDWKSGTVTLSGDALDALDIVNAVKGDTFKLGQSTVVTAGQDATATYTDAQKAVEGTKSKTEAYGLMEKALKQANAIGVTNNDSDVVNNGDGTFTITRGSTQVAETLAFNLHVGSDADMTNKISVSINTMNTSYLGIKGLDVIGKDANGNKINDGGEAATYAIDAIEDAIKKVSEQRSALGAVQNRLEHTVKNVDNVIENTTAAESQIRDTDMATEMVQYSKNNILAQAGQSMLAQANQSNQGVLSLLG